MNKTSIPYLDFTWNPVTGCSYGCPECWARRIAKRFGDADFKPTFHPERLGEPAKRKKPATIGVSFMGDLFDPKAVAGAAPTAMNRAIDAPQHIYVFLTKRANVMAEALNPRFNWTPKPNWYMGVTVRTQSKLDAAAPHIRAMAEAGWKVWLSIEPMQGPVDIDDLLGNCLLRTAPSSLVGVILGGQSGPDTKRLPQDWVRTIRDQCADAGIAFNFKQTSDATKSTGWPHKNGVPFLDGRLHTALPWALHTKELP